MHGSGLKGRGGRAAGSRSDAVEARTASERVAAAD